MLGSSMIGIPYFPVRTTAHRCTDNTHSAFYTISLPSEYALTEDWFSKAIVTKLQNLIVDPISLVPMIKHSSWRGPNLYMYPLVPLELRVEELFGVSFSQVNSHTRSSLDYSIHIQCH